ncbi:MAG: hypothetical protein HOV87_32305 [Catenulispora sp.]|nr:hypothetical protein [Catenulispora sp.]
MPFSKPFSARNRSAARKPVVVLAGAVVLLSTAYTAVGASAAEARGTTINAQADSGPTVSSPACSACWENGP